MYCIKCGVKLADSEKKCPLCGTVPYHPEIPRTPGEPLYPTNHYPKTEVSPMVAQRVLLILFILPMLVTLLVDLRINQTVTWSGFVIGALLMSYVILCLPGWFRNPNPVIFVPCGFAAIGLYLLYIDLVLEGGWFLSFAFPVLGGITLIVTAVVTLMRYVRRGQLYIFGGAAMAFGALMLLVEFLVVITFQRPFVGWSIYPLAVLGAIGGFLIFLAIDRAAREMIERKLFI